MSNYSPAALILMAAGISLTDLGNELGYTKQALSYHLAGRSRSTPDGLAEAITDLADAYTADRVLEAILEARRAS